MKTKNPASSNNRDKTIVSIRTERTGRPRPAHAGGRRAEAEAAWAALTRPRGEARERT